MNLMNRLFFIAFLIFASFHSKGQGSDSLLKAKALDKYDGRWEWRSDSSLFILQLNVIVHTFKFRNDSATKKVVVGFHEYWEDGRLVESNLQLACSNSPDQSSFVGSADSTGRLVGTFRDSTYGAPLYVDLPYLIVTGKPAIVWQSRYQELIVFVHDNRKLGRRRTIPSNVVLKKIE